MFNVKLVLATSASRKDTEIIINMFALNKYFTSIISGDCVDNGKPAPDIFLYAAEVINVKSKECIVIEDSKNGIDAAKKAGMKCVGYKNLNSGDQDLSCADLIIESFKEIN